MRRGTPSPGSPPAHGRGARRDRTPAGGNREDLRQGTAPPLRLLAAGDRPSVHLDRRRPLRGRGRPAHARRRPGAVALRVLVQPRPAPQVPPRLGTGPYRGPARRRAAGPGHRRPRLVERRHRRHRPPGLAAGPPRLAGVRAEDPRGRGGLRRAVRDGARQRRRADLPRGGGRGGLGPAAGPGPYRGPVDPAALLRAPLGRGDPARRGSARRADHRFG